MEKHILKYNGEEVDHLLAKIEQAPDAIASEAYVQTEVANLVNSAPETLDTLGEVAKAIQDNETVVDALNSAIGNKADKSEIPDMSKYATQDYVQQAILAGTPVLTTIVPTSIVSDSNATKKTLSFSFPTEYHTDADHGVAGYGFPFALGDGITLSFKSDASDVSSSKTPVSISAQRVIPCSYYGPTATYAQSGENASTYLIFNAPVAASFTYGWLYTNTSGNLTTKIYGSNDNSTWTLLATKTTNQTTASFSSSVCYQYYRVQVVDSTARTAWYNKFKLNSASLIGYRINYNIPIVTNYIAGLTIKVQVSSIGPLNRYYQPLLQINNLGGKTVNGTLNANSVYTLVYNGTSFDIQN